jgi:monofunctional biosynthetic peptidoglycan transglycosylase
MARGRWGKPRRSLWRWGLAAVVLVLYVQIGYLAGVLWWTWFNPSNTAFMEAGLDRLQEKKPGAELRHKWVDYKRISIHLKRAVVAAEDSRFLEHEGFDWEAMEKAVQKNIKKGRFAAGGSTISQQLAKNLFLSASKNPFRKLQEAVITVMIEQLWSKRRILEVYLNVIEWGNGIYGAEAAARRYFKTSAAGLGPGQAAHLAAMIPNPRYYETHRAARGLLRRQAIITARMRLVAVPR